MEGEEDSEDFIAVLNSREPTLCKDFNLNIRGWDNDNEEEARAFGNELYAGIATLSRILDLSRLEGVVIGMDYREALASVSQNEGVPPAAPTSNEYGVGCAMAQTVIRNDEIWSVVVIWTPLIRPFLDKE